MRIFGAVVAFSCGKLDGALFAHQAELMVLRQGLSLAASLQLRLAVIECDAFNVVKDVNSYFFDSMIVFLVEDVVDLLHLVGIFRVVS